jgi:hypothetical protein
MPRAFPAALRHGEIREVFPDVFFVTGTIKMGGPIRFSRNMTIVREGGRLILVNTVRLDEAGLAALDKLGKVTDVLRIAGFHGMDDPFYAERYGAKVWAVRGHKYTEGFEQNVEAYFAPQVEMDAHTALPIEGARLHVIRSRVPEAILVLPRSGGVLVTGDALQNWGTTDEFMSFVTKPMMRMMGFIRPHNVGPAWHKQTKPPKEDMVGILSLGFDKVLPAHGTPVLENAETLYRPAITRVTQAG